MSKKKELDTNAVYSELSGSAFFNPQMDKTTSTHDNKPTKPLKYTTHLKSETIKAIKRYAFEHEMKDYEVVQAAIDEFLAKDS